MSTENEENEKYDSTYTEWTHQEDQWLWDKYAEGATLDKICDVLGRYPDDVILHMTAHSSIKPEDIAGFGSADHLQLWHQQQRAFRTNPLFNLRKEIRQREFDTKLYDMLRELYFRKK